MSSLGDGSYDFVSANSRTMYTTAHAAITQLELWDFIKKDPGQGGFMFCNAEEINLIASKIEQLGYNGHSGASFGCTMRAMQYIAKHGYETFKEEYTRNS